MPTPTQEGIFIVVAVAVLANLAVAIGLFVSLRYRRGRGPRDAVADINRLVLLGAQSGGGEGHDHAGAASAARPGVRDVVADDTHRVADASVAVQPAPPSAPAEPTAAIWPRLRPVAVTPTDVPAGFDGPATWSDRLTEENARIQRYGRPATVVLIELADVDRPAMRHGRAGGGELIPPIATALLRNARSADRQARLGPTRFATLLPETDEVEAINYVERIRSKYDGGLDDGAASAGLSIGWAEINVDQPADPALEAAERRLNEERQRLRGEEVDAADDDREGAATRPEPILA